MLSSAIWRGCFEHNSGSKGISGIDCADELLRCNWVECHCAGRQLPSWNVMHGCRRKKRGRRKTSPARRRVSGSGSRRCCRRRRRRKGGSKGWQQQQLSLPQHPPHGHRQKNSFPRLSTRCNARIARFSLSNRELVDLVNLHQLGAHSTACSYRNCTRSSASRGRWAAEHSHEH